MIDVIRPWAKLVVDVDVAEHEIVGVLLLELRELLALAERHRRPRVVYGFARMLKMSLRFQPSVSTRWYTIRGVIVRLSLG